MMAAVPRTRLIGIEDASKLAQLVERDREFLAPWEPTRPDEYFTSDGQRRAIEEALKQYQQRAVVPRVILEDGAIIGRVTLSNIVRGAFQSCNLGYWVSAACTGRGFATAAVQEIMAEAFLEMRLHRIEAGTLLHNVASQRVLEKNGFVRFGVAPQYLHIAGRWQDHAMYQVLNPG